MDITNLFTNSAKFLQEYPKLSLPFILNQLLFYILFFTILSLNIFSESSIVSEIELFEFLIYIIVGFIVWFCLSTILSSWGYYQNVSFVRNKKTSLSDSFLKSLKYFTKLLAVRLLYFLIVFVPIILLFVGVFFSFLAHILIGIFFTLLSSLIIISWIVFISVKLFYAEAQIFMEENKKYSALKYIKTAYSFSKGKSGPIILLFLIILVIHFTINTLTSNPFTGIIFEFIKNYQMIIYYTLAVMFSIAISIITGATSAFTNLMIVKSYLEFQKKDKK